MILHSLRHGRARTFLAAVPALLALTALSACDDATSASDLMGGAWRLRSLQNAELGTRTLDDPDQFTVDFTESARLNVQADCNGCGGTYSLADDSLTVSDLNCTLIACPAAPLDAAFLAILNGESSVELEEDELTISSSRGTLRFTR
jgi:heat shock protein HslJ